MVVGVIDDRPSESEADALFGALADATRRDIVTRTMHGDHSVSALARMYPMSFAAIQKHVAILERAGLVTKERRGREQVVRCNLESLRTAHRALDELETVWRARLDRFGDLLPTPDSPHEPATDSAPNAAPDFAHEGART